MANSLQIGFEPFCCMEIKNVSGWTCGHLSSDLTMVVKISIQGDFV